MEKRPCSAWKQLTLRASSLGIHQGLPGSLYDCRRVQVQVRLFAYDALRQDL
jgi:hypothetical protein